MKRLIKRMPVIGPIIRAIYRRYVHYSRSSFSSEAYWEKRYHSGGNSGDGSYGELAEFKAGVLNEFIRKQNVSTVIEYGCGDGNQLKLVKYPSYIGFDVSPTGIDLCRSMFCDDSTKTFRLMQDYRGETAELTLSLDVIYHLIQDDIYHDYMHRLFDSGQRFVIIYASNTNRQQKPQAKHVRHRKFSKWVEQSKPNYRLRKRVPNKYPFDVITSTGSLSDFYIYERV